MNGRYEKPFDTCTKTRSPSLDYILGKNLKRVVVLVPTYHTLDGNVRDAFDIAIIT